MPNSLEPTYKDLHFNTKQIEVHVVQANVTSCVLARGTGKTHGITAPRMITLAEQMPRGFFFFVGPSHRFLTDQVIPGVMEALDEIGLKKNIHYRKGEFFPSSWGVPMPFRELNEPQKQKKYIMHFASGACFLFISQRNPGSSNSINFDGGLAEEYRFVDHEKFLSETMPAIRGNEQHFRDCPLHGSVLILTDRPRTAEQRGIYYWQDQHNAEQIETIKGLAYECEQVQQKLEDPNFRRGRNKTQERYNALWELLTWHRQNATLYLEADALDNVEVLGISKLEREYAGKIPKKEFLISRGNFDLGDIEFKYYHIRKSTHSYTDHIKAAYQHQNESERNWRWDTDLDTNRPLLIGMDNNTKINCVVDGQLYPEEIRIVRAAFVLKAEGEKLAQLFEQWCRYYEGFPTKKVIFCRDQTTNSTNWESDMTPFRRARGVLKKHGWEVQDAYRIMGSDGHDLFWSYDKMLDEEDHIENENNYRLRVNFQKANSLWKSMSKTIAKETANGRIKKVKTPEQNSAVRPEDAPHLSEAADNIIDTVLNYIGLLHNDPVW